MSGKKWKRYRPEHSRMFNDPRWADLKRLVWHRDGGRCQMCKREGIEAGIQDGYIRSGFACHHIVPFESARTQAEMERLFFDPNNLMLVCKSCHAMIHKELGSKTKEAVAARRTERFERWKDKMQSGALPGDGYVAAACHVPVPNSSAEGEPTDDIDR